MSFEERLPGTVLVPGCLVVHVRDPMRLGMLIANVNDSLLVLWQNEPNWDNVFNNLQFHYVAKPVMPGTSLKLPKTFK
jgi:hypothetical protein